MLFEGAIEGGLGFVADFGRGPGDAKSSLFEQPTRELQAPACHISDSAVGTRRRNRKNVWRRPCARGRRGVVGQSGPAGAGKYGVQRDHVLGAGHGGGGDLRSAGRFAGPRVTRVDIEINAWLSRTARSTSDRTSMRLFPIRHVNCKGDRSQSATSPKNAGERFANLSKKSGRSGIPAPRAGI